MENPAKRTVRAILLVILGIGIGVVPGAIKIDQMRHEALVAREAARNQTADLQAKLTNLLNSDMMAQQTTIDRLKYRTLLISNGGPMPHREVVGIEEPWTHLDVGLTTGTIWVIPGLVQPHTLLPDERAAWAVVNPDGHVGRWSQAPFNYTIAEKTP